MNRAAPLLVFLLLAAACAPVAPPAPGPAPEQVLATELEDIFADTLFAHATWGAAVRSLDTGDWLYRNGAERLLMPASNMKLVTGAAALAALGPEYRWQTQVSATGPVGDDGVLRGDLVVWGGGDPTISERFYEDDPDAVFRDWADSLRTAGVQRITGDVVGVDWVFGSNPYGRGWSWDFLQRGYASGISGLTFNDNWVRVRIAPNGAVGELPSVTLEPATAHIPVTNRAVISASGTNNSVDGDFPAAGSGLVVTGEIAADADPVVRTFAVRDPTRYFSTALHESLTRSGIEVTGGVRAPARDDPEAPHPDSVFPLFSHASFPMDTVLTEFMLPSQNQIAEILLRTLGSEFRSNGSTGDGAAVIDSLFEDRGLSAGQLLIADGSGLSRYNFVTPDLLVELLTYMDEHPEAGVWMASLPVAGRTGTLRNRMRSTPAEDNVRAKTGTISNVRALSGYLTTADGERLAFSMIANNHPRSASDVDRVVEQAIMRLVEFRR